MNRLRYTVAIATLLFACVTAVFADDVVVDENEGIAFFEKKVRPVLVRECYECHSAGAKKVQGGLQLDSRQGARSGGESGPAVVPGDVEASLLIEAVRHESFAMPPKSKLSDNVIADLETWIRIGAPDPRDSETPAPTSSSIDFVAGREFWSFQAPTRHAPPQISNPHWPSRRIDAFVLAQLDQRGLHPSPPADRRTLIRRVSYDLTGLPPTPGEIDAFINNPAPDAYEQLVDRLLASPRYGERWARMWLDVARYAEDQAHIVGSNKSLFYPNAYRYRDWVIKAFNDDLPFDRFVLQQLAADLIENADGSNDVALGFLGLGPKYYRRKSPEVMADEWEDRVDTVARGLLGLTVACARCHDHKYDPIATQDYYSLAGVFASTEMFNRPLDKDCETSDNGQAKDPEDALHIIRDTKPTDLHVFVRGDVNVKGPVVPRGFPRILCKDKRIQFDHGSGRLELAEVISDPSNPLTARVLVNRIWAQLLGRPLVGTPSNFGKLGERPTHPLLLDDLAVRFMASGWSIKWLQREILLSSTYRQDSLRDPNKESSDPANKLLWRMNPKRLSVEAWRDTILAVSGHLNGTVGGKSIDPTDPKQHRRTVYSRVSRLELHPLLALFDFPDPNVHSARRTATTTPLQKLFVLNSPFMVHYSDAFAKRLASDAGQEGEGRVRHAYRLLYGRQPTANELRLALGYLGRAATEQAERWQSYAQVLLASNELLIVD